jgi:hypothetical protein
MDRRPVGSFRAADLGDCPNSVNPLMDNAPAPSAPAANLAELLLGQLSAADIGVAFARAISPLAASDEAWSSLLSAMSPVFPAVMSDMSQFLFAWDSHRGSTEFSPEGIARLTALIDAFSLSGEAGATVERRFAESFGSQAWIDWALHGLDGKNDWQRREGFLDFASDLAQRCADQGALGNRAVLPWLRVWLHAEYVSAGTSRDGAWALDICDALGVLDALLEDREILAGALRQAALQRSLWSPYMISRLEAFSLAREMAAGREASAKPTPGEAAPADAPSRRL